MSDGGNETPLPFVGERCGLISWAFDPWSPERIKHVVRVSYEGCAVTDEREASRDFGAIHIAGENQDGERAIRRPRCGVERARARGGLDHHNGVGERRDDSVALQELIRPHRFVRRIRRENGAAARDHASGEFAIARREEMVVPAAEHAERWGAGKERAFMRGGIDPKGKAGDDANAAETQLVRESACAFSTSLAWRSRANDRDRRRGEALERSGNVQSRECQAREAIAGDFVEFGTGNEAAVGRRKIGCVHTTRSRPRHAAAIPLVIPSWRPHEDCRVALGIRGGDCGRATLTQARPMGETNEMASQAYCVKCKTKREMKDATQITMKNGRPATEGKCPECGTKMFKIGAAT